jgi:hypothetical protein
MSVVKFVALLMIILLELKRKKNYCEIISYRGHKTLWFADKKVLCEVVNTLNSVVNGKKYGAVNLLILISKKEKTKIIFSTTY